MKSNIFSWAFVAAVALLSSCSSDEPDNKSGYVDAVLPENTRAAVTAENEFATKLIKELAANDDNNFVISPYTVFSTMAMLANGDDGVSRDEALSIIGYQPDNAGLQSLNEYIRIVHQTIGRISSKERCVLSNSVWHKPSLSLNSNYVSSLSDYFSASTFAVDLNSEAGKSNVNSWISSQTNGLIPNFLSAPINLDAAVLSVAYFKGEWSDKFDSALTKDGTFHNIDGTNSNAKFMHKEMNAEYAEGNGIKAVTLPYGNGNYRLTALIPVDANGFQSMLSNLDSEELNNLLLYSTSASVKLAFPKFSTQSKYSNLVSTLEAMGLKNGKSVGYNSIFESGNNFILNMMQNQTNIEVDENGTVAASATLAGGVLAPGPLKEVELEFNRPFIYVIRENATNTILFAGCIKKF